LISFESEFGGAQCKLCDEFGLTVEAKYMERQPVFRRRQ